MRSPRVGERAGGGLRLRVATVTGVLLLLTLAYPGVSGAAVLADRDPTAEGQLSFTVLGPVGFVAVALGLVGLVCGFLRHRSLRHRKKAARHAAESAQPRLSPSRPLH